MSNKREFTDRLSYSIYAIPLPKSTARKDINTIIRAKLVPLYPLSLNGKTILVLKNAGDRNSRVVIVCSQDFFENNKYTICSSVLVMKLLKRKTGTCICITSDFVEHITLERGRFISSTVLSRTEDADIAKILTEDAIAVISDARNAALIQSKGRKPSRFFDVSFLSGQTIRQAKFVMFSPKQKRNKIILFLLLAALFAVIGILAARQQIQMAAEIRMIERAQEEEARRHEAERREKEALAQTLEAEYTDCVSNMLPDMFDVCNKMFLSIDAGTKIDNLTISGNTFQFDAHGNDAIKILTQYEENTYITGIYLNRVVVEGQEDSFTIEGEVKQRIMLPDDDSVDRKIAFYQHELKRFQEESGIKQSRRPSEISAVIREIVLQNRCRLESIQYYNTEYGLEIEYAIQARSTSFFSFLQDVSQSDEHLVISSIRIRSYLEGGTLSAVIRFRTGIMLDDESLEDIPFSDDNASFTPEELAEYFIIRRRTVPIPEVLPEPKIVEVPAVVRNPSFLQYVGSAGNSQGEQFVLIKDTRNDAIIKLRNDLEQEQYFISNEGNRLEIKYQGTLYEVQK